LGKDKTKKDPKKSISTRGWKSDPKITMTLKKGALWKPDKKLTMKIKETRERKKPSDRD
jgi:hypothetical protein